MLFSDWLSLREQNIHLFKEFILKGNGNTNKAIRMADKIRKQNSNLCNLLSSRLMNALKPQLDLLLKEKVDNDNFILHGKKIKDTTIELQSEMMMSCTSHELHDLMLGYVIIEEDGYYPYMSFEMNLEELNNINVDFDLDNVSKDILFVVEDSLIHPMLKADNEQFMEEL